MSENNQYQIPGEKFSHDDEVYLRTASSSLEPLEVIKAAAEAHRAASMNVAETHNLPYTPQQKLTLWSHNLQAVRTQTSAGNIDLESDDTFDTATLEQQSLKFVDLAHQEYKDAAQADVDLAA